MTDRANRIPARPPASDTTAAPGQWPEGRSRQRPSASQFTDLGDLRALIDRAERSMGVAPLTGRTRPRPGY